MHLCNPPLLAPQGTPASAVHHNWEPEPSNEFTDLTAVGIPVLATRVISREIGEWP